MSHTLRIAPAAAWIALILSLTGCGSSTAGPARADGLSGDIKIDGSETVFPIVDTMGEDFRDLHQGVTPVVNRSGTGSGFQKFIRGDIDIATASRPITPSEEDSLKSAKIQFLEIPLAYDGVCIVVNAANTSVKSMSPAQLKRMWEEGSKVATWADVHPGWPAEKIDFYGPTDNHGTYQYFTETIDGKLGDIRADYQPNQDYNVVIQDVAGDKNGIGYCGLNYYLENMDKVRAIAIDGGKGPVMPTQQSVDSGAYTPLSRPLFLYVNKAAYARPEVKAFIEYALGRGGESAIKETNYVTLGPTLSAEIKKRLASQITGSIFDKSRPGETTAQVLGRAK